MPKGRTPPDWVYDCVREGNPVSKLQRRGNVGELGTRARWICSFFTWLPHNPATLLRLLMDQVTKGGSPHLLDTGDVPRDILDRNGVFDRQPMALAFNACFVNEYSTIGRQT